MSEWTIIVCPLCRDQVEWDYGRACWRHDPRTEANDHCGWNRHGHPDQVEVVPARKLEIAEEALRFYADESNYDGWAPVFCEPGDGHFAGACEYDKGRQARSALSRLREDGEGSDVH